MARAGKDDPLVVKFMTSFQRLHDTIDDDPTGLEHLPAGDEDLTKLCNDLLDAAVELTKSERHGRHRFTAPANPDFIPKWRRYEEHYSKPVTRVWLRSLGFEPSVHHTVGHLSPESMWPIADETAKAQVDAIRLAMDLAYDDATNNRSDLQSSRDITYGIGAWHDLLNTTSLDLQRTFRRRELVPFVLVPRHVSAKYGSTEAPSLLSHLEQAHNAFVLGLDSAAFALMRATLETCLRRHYAAAGDGLREMIDSVNLRSLPVGVSHGALHRLRERANSILHSNHGNFDSAVGKDRDKELEKEILRHLYVLRALIEGTPTQKDR